MSVSALFGTFLIQWRTCNYSARLYVWNNPFSGPFSPIYHRASVAGWTMSRNYHLLCPPAGISTKCFAHQIHYWLAYLEYSGLRCILQAEYSEWQSVVGWQSFLGHEIHLPALCMRRVTRFFEAVSCQAARLAYSFLRIFSFILSCFCIFIFL